MKTYNVIILLGPPGAGKGTQAQLLSDKFGYFILETSKLLEAWFKKGGIIEVNGEQYDAEYERVEHWEKGLLCSRPIVGYLVNQKLKELHEKGEKVIMSGSPRAIYEAEAELDVLKELYGEVKTIILEITPETTIERNTHRRICTLMRHPIIYKPGTKDLKICPIDGSELKDRGALDTEESIRVRLQEYTNETKPVFDYLEGKTNLSYVDASGTVAEVFENILKCL